MIVIRVGGSLLFDENGNLNIEFLKKLKETLENVEKAIIVVGGGRFVKKIMQKLKEEFNLEKESLDWIGIRFTHFNAEIIRAILNGKFIESYDRMPEGKILVGGGEKPGCSTDYDAVYAAFKSGAKEVVKLTNVDGIFDKDPNKYKDAKLIKKASYDEILKIVGEEWRPGLKFPIDPIALKFAKEKKIKIIVMNGYKLENLKNYLGGKEFIGTVIS